MPTRKVLVVDDNRISQLVAGSLLDSFGYAFEVVEGGRQAVEAIANGDYSVVLMDIRMPEMDGMEATRMIRALETEKRHIPVIAVTSDPLIPAFAEAGIDDYVSKPIDPRVLVGKIEYWRFRRARIGLHSN